MSNWFTNTLNRVAAQIDMKLHADIYKELAKPQTIDLDALSNEAAYPPPAIEEVCEFIEYYAEVVNTTTCTKVEHK